MLARVVAIPAFAILAGCGQSVESKLIGSWQWNTCDDAGDVAYRSDHTFASREWAVTYSHQSPILIDGGEWHVRSGKLVMDFKGDTRPAEGKHVELPFTFFEDTLLLRTTGGTVNTFERLK